MVEAVLAARGCLKSSREQPGMENVGKRDDKDCEELKMRNCEP
jgi:hypothetical protein